MVNLNDHKHVAGCVTSALWWSADQEEIKKMLDNDAVSYIEQIAVNLLNTQSLQSNSL